MKTQTLVSFVWNSWKGEPAPRARGHFVPAKHKVAPETQTQTTARKTEPEIVKPRRAQGKLSAADRRELISSTQHLDACFSTMWRRAV
jgi:hypothetical protein